LASTDLSGLSEKEATTFVQRLRVHFPRLFDKYTHVYGHQYDCYFHLQKLIEVLRDGFIKRKPALKKLDNERLALNAAVRRAKRR
jgi:amylosucrase